MLSPDEVKAYLDGVRFPVKKDEVVTRFEQQPDLDPTVLRVVRRLPDITYRKPEDVVHSMDYVRTKAPYTRSNRAPPEPETTR